MKHISIYIYIWILLFLISSCKNSREIKSSQLPILPIQDTEIGLKDFYKSYFPIGASIAPRSYYEKETSLIIKEFNSVTIEYLLQLKHIYKENEGYNFQEADKIIDFARRNGLLVRGHALCWHDQIPSWYIHQEGRELTKEELTKKLENHITTMVNRYKESIYAWDVVNEAISNEDNQFMEESVYHKIMGDEYVAKAFKFARAADPKARLFYNDNNFINPIKRKKVIKLVNQLKKSKIPIDGIGIQGHWSIFGPEEKEVRDMLEDVISTGLEIQITELDISIHPKNNSERIKMNMLKLTGNLNEKELQAKQYEMLFRIFREYKSNITGVTFWNVTDHYSWMDKKDQKHTPLLFNENYERKPAYFKVIPN